MTTYPVITELPFGLRRGEIHPAWWHEAVIHLNDGHVVVVERKTDKWLTGSDSGIGRDPSRVGEYCVILYGSSDRSGIISATRSSHDVLMMQCVLNNHIDEHGGIKNEHVPTVTGDPPVVVHMAPASEHR